MEEVIDSIVENIKGIKKFNDSYKGRLRALQGVVVITQEKLESPIYNLFIYDEVKRGEAPLKDVITGKSDACILSLRTEDLEFYNKLVELINQL